MRDADEEDTMDMWDEEKLNDVIGKKHGESNTSNATDKVTPISLVHFSFYNFFLF